MSKKHKHKHKEDHLVTNFFSAIITGGYGDHNLFVDENRKHGK